MYRSSKLNEERVDSLKPAAQELIEYCDRIVEKDSIRSYLPPTYLDDDVSGIDLEPI